MSQELERLMAVGEAIEPAARELQANGRSLEEASNISTAISLKRIADSLEAIGKSGYQGWGVQDIAGIIMEKGSQ